MNKPLAALLTAALATTALPVFAADHEVKMLNRGEVGTMVFEPSALRIAPGDTVTFISADPGHNVEFINGMFPQGVEGFRSALGQDVTISFDEPGLYGVKCTPHLAMGMVALIQVGDEAVNLDDVKAVRNPPVATQRFNAAFEALEL